MVSKRGSRKYSLDAMMENKKNVKTKTKRILHVLNSAKRQKTWNGKLTASFLEYASNAIFRSNFEKEIPIIYAEEGVIYKESRSGKIPLGKITGLKRQIKEKNYTIEHITIGE
jgi:hypothetical protein